MIQWITSEACLPSHSEKPFPTLSCWLQSHSEDIISKKKKIFCVKSNWRSTEPEQLPKFYETLQVGLIWKSHFCDSVWNILVFELLIVSHFSLSMCVVPWNNDSSLYIGKTKWHPQDYDFQFCFHWSFHSIQICPSEYVG